MDSIFVFNRFKHHLLTVQAAIATTRLSGNADILYSYLKQIGESVMDLYIGELDVNTLFHEIYTQLQQLDILQHTAYHSFLAQNGNYALIKVSDGSDWVLLEGLNNTQFVHIHPARYSMHSVRVKANAWKTAIAIAAFVEKKDWYAMNTINAMRLQIELSPIKNLESAKHLTQFLRQYFE